MIGKAPFLEDAVFKMLLFAGGEALKKKLNHPYCDSTFYLAMKGLIETPGLPKQTAAEDLQDSIFCACCT